MIAIDANVAVRFLVGDDELQSRSSRRLISGGNVFVPDSVLLETEWVLRAAYRLDRQDISQAIRMLCGLPRLSVSDAARITQVLRKSCVGTKVEWTSQMPGTLVARSTAKRCALLMQVSFGLQDRRVAHRCADHERNGARSRNRTGTAG